MDETYVTANYGEQGGDKWVIGGTLEILDGAQVNGLNADVLGMSMEPIPDSSASTIAAMKDDFNSLLSALRGAGLLER